MTPFVGMKVTRNAVTDSDPATIIAMSKSGKHITIQDDDWTILSGSEMDGSAQYMYRRNWQGAISAASLRKNGEYRLNGCHKGYGLVTLGVQRRYRDPSF